MSKPVALRVKHLSKSFKLPHEKHSTLKSAIINPFKKRKSFERQQVLKDISFEIEQGEFFGIVGRNGGGKSTLLKLLAGIYAPDKGEVQTAGKLVPFIELGVGFNPELSGRDNVYLNGALLGFSDKEIDEIYEDIVEFAELERFMGQKLKNYSSGMQVRLAFSVATRANADILLVDEVLAVGDVNFQRKCYEYFASLKKKGTTVIFISHDMNAIRQYCDRVLLIDQGEIVQTGSAAQVAEAYMKLFSNTVQKASGKNESSKHWGNGDIAMDAHIKTVSKKSLLLEITATAKIAVNDQVIGISVKAPDGQIVCGTNTELLQQALPAMTAGQKLKLVWEIPNIFRDGSYTISVAAHGYGGLPVYDWWEDMLNLELAYNRESPYSVVPDIKLTVS